MRLVSFGLVFVIAVHSPSSLALVVLVVPGGGLKRVVVVVVVAC